MVGVTLRVLPFVSTVLLKTSGGGPVELLFFDGRQGQPTCTNVAQPLSITCSQTKNCASSAGESVSSLPRTPPKVGSSMWTFFLLAGVSAGTLGFSVLDSVAVAGGGACSRLELVGGLG